MAASWKTHKASAGYPRMHTWKPTRNSEMRLVQGAHKGQYYLHYYGPQGHYNLTVPESLNGGKRTAVVWADILHPRRKR